jgi:hypothetical protein
MRLHCSPKTEARHRPIACLPWASERVADCKPRHEAITPVGEDANLSAGRRCSPSVVCWAERIFGLDTARPTVGGAERFRVHASGDVVFARFESECQRNHHAEQ